MMVMVMMMFWCPLQWTKCNAAHPVQQKECELLSLLGIFLMLFYLECVVLKKKRKSNNNDQILFFSTCFISFTYHIWTEAINYYETHPSLNKLTHSHSQIHTHTYIVIHKDTHHCHSTGRNSFDLVLVLRNGIHLVLSICFFYASRAKQGPWLWLFFLFSKKNWRLFVINLLVRYLK